MTATEYYIRLRSHALGYSSASRKGGNGMNRGKGAYGGKCFNSEFMVKVWTVRTVGKVTGNCWNSRNSEIG